MIRKENSLYIVNFGNKDTFISNVIRKGETKSSGIAFSNSKDKILDGNTVIIEMFDKKNSIGYIAPIFRFLETHENDKDRLERLRNIEDSLMDFINDL